MRAYPFPKCPVCFAHDLCLATRFSKARRQGRCYRDSRKVNLRLQARYLQKLFKEAGFGYALSHERVRKLLRPVEMAQGRMSRPIEFSAGFEGELQHWCRFTVAYRDQQPDLLEEDAEMIAGCVAELLPYRSEALEAILGNLDPSMVIQLLYGLDLRREGSSRQKVYLRLVDGCPDAKRGFIERLLNQSADFRWALPPEQLRLVGLDLPHEREALEFKLYYRAGPKEEVDWGVHEVAGRSLERVIGCEKLERDLLWIQRVSQSEQEQGKITELDIHLLHGGVGMDVVERFVEQDGMKLRLDRFRALNSDYQVVPTCMTLSLGDRDKMNLYYILPRSRRDDR